MNRRWLTVLALGGGGALLAAGYASVLIGNAVERIPVPDICGFVSVQVCLGSKNPLHISKLVHIAPSAIVGMSNPTDSPPDCIKLHVGQREIYIVGDYNDIAARIQKAKLELQNNSCVKKDKSDE